MKSPLLLNIYTLDYVYKNLSFPYIVIPLIPVLRIFNPPPTPFNRNSLEFAQ